MWRSRKLGVLLFALAVIVLGVWRLKAGDPSIEAQRRQLTKSFNDGNFKVAYEGLRKLTLDPQNNPTLVGKDLELAVTCLHKLGRTDEIDDLLENAVNVH